MTSYNNILNGGGTATSRRRPKRQRTPTTIYTDDNPTTFTTKKKKGENDNNNDNKSNESKNHENDDLPYSKSPPDLATSGWSALEETVIITSSMPPPPPPVTTTKRGPGRPPRKKSVEQLALPGPVGKKACTATMTTTKNVIPDSSASSIATLVMSDSSSTNTTPVTVQTQKMVTVVKRKRGRPPKNRSKELPIMSDESCIDDQNQDLVWGNNVDGNDDDDGDETIMRSLKHTTDSPTLTKSRGPSKCLGSSMKMNHSSQHSSSKSKLKPIHAHKGKNRDTIVTSSRNSSSSIQRTTGGSGETTTPLIFRNTTSWTSPEEDLEGSFVNHSVTLAPILPLTIAHDNDNGGNSSHVGNINASRISRELMSKYPIVFDIGVPKSCSSVASLSLSSNQTSSGSLSSTSTKHNQSQQPQLPTWTPLYDPPVFFEDDYDQETGKLDVENTMPVTRHITAITVRKPDHDYLVLGDSVGFVTIYSLAKDNINLPIAQLESVACQQRGKMEQERLRAELRKRRKQNKGGKGNTKASSVFNNGNNAIISSSTGIGVRNYKSTGRAHFSSSAGARPGTPNQFLATGPQQVTSILMDTSETTIHALGMVESRIVLATSEELECMDVPSGTSLWVCPLSSNRFVTSLDMHLRTFDVLVSCSKTGGTSTEISTSDNSTEAAATPISPLMLLQHSKNNVEICDANSPMLVRSPSCSAIWDIGAQNRLLFIALSSNRQELELVLVSGGSIDSWKVACKTKIPTKTATSVAAATKLSQSPGGLYTLVASARGIRLYQTESLQLIHVYGDQLALHGQAVMWKDCWLVGSYFSESKSCRMASGGLPSQWMECDDWLGQSTSDKNVRNSLSSKEVDKKNNNQKADNSKSSTPDLAPYIIGVPHTKGPKELCEKLHVWKVEHPSVVPVMSIPLPSKGEGALGLVGGRNRNNTRSNCNTSVSEDRIVLVTNSGQGHMLLPEIESNFAGIMYPPAYQVVTDNIEYIEEEDAMDHVLTNECPHNDEEKDVDVLGYGDDDDESMDEELKEGMRQSLLEHKRQVTVRETMKHDKDVDILLADSEKEQHFLPCRPESYLRQMINTVVEEDEAPENDEQEVKFYSMNRKESPKFDMESIDSTLKPNISGVTFISNVLDIMPNMQKPKTFEDDCLSFTTTKVVVAVNPVLPARQGRGKKSRAANLETMLKASINPYLQSMMLSKQGVSVDGMGSRLRTIKVFDDGSVTNESKIPFGSSKQMTPSTENLVERKLNGEVRRDNGESFSSGSSRTRHHHNSDICLDTSLRLDHQPNSSPRQATNADEAAVVMGLLGLSPFNTTIPTIRNAVSSVSEDTGIGANANVYTKCKSNSNESTYLSATSLSSLTAKTAVNQAATGIADSSSSDRESLVEGSEGTAEQVVEKPRLGIIDSSCSACRGRHVIHSCRRRSLPIDYEEVARTERQTKAREEEEKKRMRAEKRRLADQKRKETKKQRQRELEVQRLREEEKGRSNNEEQRSLQDDFGSREPNRLRREQIVASYANQISIDQAGHQTQVIDKMDLVDYAHEKQKNQIKKVEGRLEPQIMNLQHNFGPQPLCNTNPSSTRPVATNFDRSSQPRISNNRDEVSQPNIFEQAALIHHTNSDGESAQVGFHEPRNYAVRNECGVSVLSTSEEYIPLIIPAQAPLVHATLPSVSTTLASADALLGLANLADNTLKANTLPATTSHTGEDASNIPEWHASSSTMRKPATDPKLSAVSTSHGFGAGEVKRGIPSYATIRGQLNSGNPDDSSAVATVETTTAAVNPTFTNGYGVCTRESYPCSSHSEERNQS